MNLYFLKILFYRSHTLHTAVVIYSSIDHGSKAQQQSVVLFHLYFSLRNGSNFFIYYFVNSNFNRAVKQYFTSKFN
jgi:hypothetical protein